MLLKGQHFLEKTELGYSHSLATLGYTAPMDVPPKVQPMLITFN